MFSVKKAPFTDLNPNGRTPVIVDHENDGFVLWEVRAIFFLILIFNYDFENVIHCAKGCLGMRMRGALTK